MNLVSILRDRAVRHPDRLALIDRHRGQDRSVTFSQLWHRVESGSEQLRALGLKRGSTILVFQPVTIELYEVLLAAFHGGMRVMLADPSAGKAFLAFCCQRIPPDAFFGPWWAQVLRLAVAPLRTIPSSIRSGGYFPGASRWRLESGKCSQLVDVPAEEAALITFTSGSTGLPKAAVRTHGFLLAQHAALSTSLVFEEGEVDLITLPVFVLANLASGLTSVLADTDLRAPGKADAVAIRRQCQRHGVTRCSGSPAFFEALLRTPAGLSMFSKIFTGGAPVFPDLLERLQSAAPRAHVAAVFGSTEAEPIAHCDATEYTDDLLSRTAAGEGLCAGHPIPEINLCILSDHWGQAVPSLSEEKFREMLAVPGAVGEVIVSGAHVLSGYLDGVGDEETKIRVRGEIWHRTGDAGWLDVEGRLWLLGRCAAKLPIASRYQSGGSQDRLNYPFAIEAALRVSFPNVRMAALGYRNKRLLVLEARVDPEVRSEIELHALSLSMDRIVTVPRLPLDRRHQAKIDYPALLGKLQRLDL